MGVGTGVGGEMIVVEIAGVSCVDGRRRTIGGYAETDADDYDREYEAL